MKRKCKKNKKWILAVFAFVMASMFLFSATAYASDQTVVFTEDPADAEKGKAYIGAIVEKGFKGEITVELYPDFHGGSMHKYTLSKENGYLLSDNIMTGSYYAVAYLSGEDRGKGETATYGGEALKVRPGSEDAPYFAAIAGSSDFVEEYGWLSVYATGKGTELCGPVTWEEAKGFFQDAVARQDQKTETDISEPESNTDVWEPEIDITENHPSAKTDNKQENKSEETQDTEAEHPAGKTEKDHRGGIACIVAGCIVIIIGAKAKASR